jgi:hypothetical protein
MSTDTAIQRLRDANPAPEPGQLFRESDDLTALLHETWQRSTDMQTQTPQKLEPEDRETNRGWLIAMAVAAGIVLVVGALALLPMTRGSDVVDETPNTTIAVDVDPEAEALPVEITTTSAGIVSRPTTVQVQAFDYGFRGIPDEMTAGDALEFTNTSASEYHNLVVFALDVEDLRTLEDYAAIAPEDFEEDLTAVGHLDAAPGEEAFNGRIRLQTPGRYLAIDMSREGADPLAVETVVNPPDPSTAGSPPYLVPGGQLGYENGMIFIFTVIDK